MEGGFKFSSVEGTKSKREMERKGKVREEEKDGKFGAPKDRDKLNKGGMLLVVGKKGGPSTPSPTWRLEFPSVSPNLERINDHPLQVFLHSNCRVTARKLCAYLWEAQPQLLPGIDYQFSRTGKRGAGAPRGRQGLAQDSELKVKGRLVDLPCSSSRPVQVAPRSDAILPTSSLDFKGKKVEPDGNKFKTSTELLKVLNKILSLEEQAASNISLQKSLKLEIEDSHLKIRGLLKERKKNRQEMDILRKEAVKNRAHVRNRELEHVEAAVRSARHELGEERTLRKQSETLHRKLGREVSKVQSSLFLSIKEVEQERKNRLLLEDLCDEFALEIKDYEHEVRSLRRKADVDHSGVEKSDRLVLHISEAWLDGRMQMKLADAQCHPAEKDNIARKLRLDIETFLHARRSSEPRKGKGLQSYTMQDCCRRESFPLHGSSSAPKDAAYEENSSDSNLDCYELTKSASKGHNILISKERNQFPGEEKGELRLENQTEAGNMGRTDIHKGRQEGFDDKNGKWHGNFPPCPGFILNDGTRIYSMSSEGDKICPVSDIKEESYILPVSERYASPIKQWMSKLPTPEFESSSKLLENDVKENTLKAKLLEARLEDQRYRLKADRAPS